MIELQYITLNKLTDIAYQLGFDRTPVHFLFAGAKGIGKTWATKALKDVLFVDYVSGVMSPNEQRKNYAENSERVRLRIQDDMGLAARWNAKEFFSNYIMAMDGEMIYTQCKSCIRVKIIQSFIGCCTDLYFNEHYPEMAGMGMLDRLLPIVVRLSDKSRKFYQESALVDMNLNHSDPPKREPNLRDKRPINLDILKKYDISPRFLKSLKRCAQYLTDQELEELIIIVHSRPYECEI